MTLTVESVAAASGDGAADPLRVDDPVAGPVGGQKVHPRSLPEEQQVNI